MKAMRCLKTGAGKAVLAVATAVACWLGNPGEASAKSTFVELTIEPMWSGPIRPGDVVNYKITATRREQGLLEVALTCGGMPDCVTVEFTPGILRFTGRVPETQAAIMTITCDGSSLPYLKWPFTVTGRSRNESVTIKHSVEFSPALPSCPVLSIEGFGIDEVIIRGEQAIPSKLYELQSTPDVVNPVWNPFGSSAADGDGRFVFTVAKTEAMRFFRTVALD